MKSYLLCTYGARTAHVLGGRPLCVAAGQLAARPADVRRSVYLLYIVHAPRLYSLWLYVRRYAAFYLLFYLVLARVFLAIVQAGPGLGGVGTGLGGAGQAVGGARLP